MANQVFEAASVWRRFQCGSETFLFDWEGKLVPGILGKPIYVTLSIPGDVGGSPVANSTIVFGDLDHFHLRCSRPTLQRTTQQAGMDITKGEALYVARVRMDSTLFDPSNGSNPPVVTAAVTA